MMPLSRLGCPLSLKTPNMGNPGLTAWHWLTTADDGAGFDMVFTALRRSPRPSDAEAYDAIHTLLAGNACRTHAPEVMVDAARQGWPLAYALAWLSVSGGNSVMPPWVRFQFPEAGRLVRRLRDVACILNLLPFALNLSSQPQAGSNTSAPNSTRFPFAGLSSVIRGLPDAASLLAKASVLLPCAAWAMKTRGASSATKLLRHGESL